MVDEREEMSILYVIFVIAVILALVIVFGVRARYATNPVRRSRYDGASSDKFFDGARGDASVKHDRKPDIVRCAAGPPIFPRRTARALSSNEWEP